MNQETRHTLNVTSHEIAGITFVKMQGSLASTTAAQGNEEMKKILDTGAKKIVLNLGGLDYMSSAGMRVLLLTSKLLANVQGAMRISEAKGVVGEALATSGFNAMIQMCSTDEEALASFKGK
jgi:anti-anti-sigma factor